MLARDIKCQMCGATFTCRRWFGCWCTRVELTKERGEELRRQVDDCVCPACLVPHAATASE